MQRTCKHNQNCTNTINMSKKLSTVTDCCTNIYGGETPSDEKTEISNEIFADIQNRKKPQKRRLSLMKKIN